MPETGGQSAGAHRHWWRDPQLVVPVVAGLVYVLVVVVRLPEILSSFYWYADFPAALHLGDAVFHAGWGHGVPLRDQAGLGPLWFVGLLDQVSGNAVAGMALGGAMMIASIALMVSTARQVMKTTNAVLVGVLCVAAPPVVAWEALSPLAHGCTVLITAASAWQLVALSRQPVRHSVASSLAAGALAGVCIASDTLAVAAAVGPWLICASVLAHRRPDRRGVLLITAGIASLTAIAITVIAHANGIDSTGVSAPGLSLAGVGAGLRVAASTLGQMISGAWYDDALPGALAIAAFVLFAALFYLAIRGVAGRRAHTSADSDVYVYFWALSGAGLIGALCVTGLGVQTSPINYQGHYLDGLWFALAAVLPIAFGTAGWRRRVVVGVVACLALVSAAGVIRLTPYPFEGTDYTDAAQLTATLTELGVAQGYGGYWELYSVGWNVGKGVSVLPLQPCRYASGAAGLCRFQHAAPASYALRPGPVFIIVLRGSCHDDLCIDASNLAALPAAEDVREVGLLQVDVYPRDFFAELPVA